MHITPRKPQLLLERRPRTETAEVGDRRVWSSGLWEKQQDGSWRLVPGYRRHLKRMAETGLDHKGRPVPKKDLRLIKNQLAKGRLGCPKGSWADPQTQTCNKVKKIAKHVEKMLARIPALKDLSGSPTSRLVRATEEFKAWQDWYQRSGEMIAKLSGLHKDLVIGVFAATSAATETKANVSIAFKALRDIATTPPGERPKLLGIMGGHVKNIRRVLRGLTPSGPKVDPFTRALRGDRNAIPIDRHIGFILFGRAPKDNPKEHQLAQRILQRVADKLGIDGRDVQAALWALSITASGNTAVSYDELIAQRQEEYDELIAALDKMKQAEYKHGFETSGWESSYRPKGLREVIERRLALTERLRRLRESLQERQ